MNSEGSRNNQHRDMGLKQKHAVKMVTHQSDSNVECLLRQNLDKVLTTGKTCVASGDNCKNWTCFLAKLLVGGDHVSF